VFAHVTIHASDHEASERLVLAALGVEETSSDEWFDFSVAHYGLSSSTPTATTSRS
jgi:hypothetical protein